VDTEGSSVQGFHSQSHTCKMGCFLNYFKMFARSKVSAGQSWMVFRVSPAVIQNYGAKMTKKLPKMFQIESNTCFSFYKHENFGVGPKYA
jgi:hypothetical protein